MGKHNIKSKKEIQEDESLDSPHLSQNENDFEFINDNASNESLYSVVSTEQLNVDSPSAAATSKRNELYRYVSEEMLKYAKAFVNESLYIIKFTLNKLNILTQKSEAIQEKIHELQGVLRQIESIDFEAGMENDDDFYAVAKEITNLEENYLAMCEKPEYKTDTELLKNILEEVGIVASEERLTEERRLLVENFENAFDSFIATLSEAERAAEEELIDLYARFSAENDFEDKYGYFDEFWSNFE